MARIIELSHIIADGTVTYPGLPAPSITDYLPRTESEALYAPGTTFHIGRIDMVANTGTYIDVPSHRFAEGADLAAAPVESMANLSGVKVTATEPALRPAHLAGIEVKGRAVLIETGWSRHFGTPSYAVGAPFVTAGAAAWLVDHGVALVGIDSINIDDTEDPTRPAHTRLLAANVPIVEHLTGLSALPSSGFRFFALPPRIAGMGTFPVRAIALVG